MTPSDTPPDALAEGLDEITDLATLRAVYGDASQRVYDKELTRLDRHCLRIIALSPMVMLSTSDGDRVNVTPRGDAPGFVQADGDRAVLIPDWPGNRRLDAMTDILAHPRAGLLFLIPGFKETLRINGPARILRGEAVRARFETRGRLPITVLRVEVETAFMHCAKAFMRSSLWNPESWPAPEALPSPGEIFKDHIRHDGPVEDAETIHARYAPGLY